MQDTQKKLDRRVQATREGLLDALFALMAERGYERLTIQNLLDRADVGRATFYAHFESKDELLACSVARLRAGLVEAWKATSAALVLEVWKGTNMLAQTSLNLSISPVEQMFRQKSLLLHQPVGNVPPPDRLADSDVPNEPENNGKNFVFVHGYNVNPQEARGWSADIFKRLYWSGSHAKFYCVTWEAYDTQIAGALTINLQTNIVNAFQTASNFATFIGTLTNETVVAAHSLGNMLVLASLNDCTNINFNISKFFMIDAAVRRRV